MAKVLIVLIALVSIGAAAPLPKETARKLQDRKTVMSWENGANMIAEVLRKSPAATTSVASGQEQQPTGAESRSERMGDYVDRQGDRSGAGWLEDRETRAREAIGRAEGRVPEREALRRGGKMGQARKGKLSRGSKKAQLADQIIGEGDNGFPLYDFAYGVYDPVTGDKKEQWEKRVGDYVKGKYTLDQPDGTRRIVEYEADDKNGFEAIVQEIDRIDDRNGGGPVKWGHTDADVAQSYSRLNKYD
ncbi:pro-resilin-like [Anopheles cruzii]|uniref:pro-resilin-like n=1 Tax=Anopheles cruzii TaxID=68878 RepID=UPI0022EC1F80|nr:pro-resilin-like [Anopheles cruzii]